MITNLNTVLHTFATRDKQFADGLDKLSQLVEGLSERKTDITKDVAYINAAAGSVADLLTTARQPIKDVVQDGPVRGQVEADHDYVDDLVKTLPDVYQVLSRKGLYGDYFGFYICDVIIKLNGKRTTRVRQAGEPGNRAVHAAMKRTQASSRSPTATGSPSAWSASHRRCVVVAVFSYDKIPLSRTPTTIPRISPRPAESSRTVRASVRAVGRQGVQRQIGRDEGAGQVHRRRRCRTGQPHRSVDQDRDRARHKDARDNSAWRRQAQRPHPGRAHSRAL